MTRVASRRLAGALFLLASASAPPAVAQEEPVSIPTPLVMALLGNAGIRPSISRIAVGAPLRGFPAVLVPAGLEVLGGAWIRGALTTIFADSSGQALSRYQRRLEDAGFRQPQPPVESGFQSTPVTSAYYCGDSGSVRPALLREASGRQLLEVSYYGARSGVTPCDQSSAVRTAPREYGLPIPALLPPPRTSHRRGGGSSGGDETSAIAMLADSSRSAATVVTHYGAQLTAAGWTVSPPLAGPGVAISTLSARDKEGGRWQGTLLVTTTGKTHRISLQMRKPEDR